jgi:predicted alpha-1,2-mannosidase
MDIMGGRESFVGRLDSLFSTPVEEQVAWTGQKVGRFGFIGQYAHTNEPVHHVAYLYNYAGEPWKCQEKIREILNTQYNTSPGGMCGNDDTGQMSAWFVMSALGFYPVTHGQDIFVIGSPLFKKVELRHSKGTLTILARGNAPGSPYVKGVKVNGRNHRKNYFRGKDLFEGDVTVEFEMASKPNPSWGSRPKDCPPGIDGKAGKMSNINPFNRNRWRK